jgi:TRAP-type mannitol/chloroaromatic compound transport system permease small subunit
VVLGLAGLLLGMFALLTVRPVASELLNTAWPVGVGWLLMIAGFTLLALSGLSQLFGARE